MESSENNNFFLNIFKGVGIAIIFTVVCLTVFSVLLVYTNMSESLIQPVVIGVTGISILVGSFIANKKMTKNGIFNGAIIGGLYILLIYVISSVVNGGNFALNLGAVVMIATGIVGGAMGGIIGINLKWSIWNVLCLVL